MAAQNARELVHDFAPDGLPPDSNRDDVSLIAAEYGAVRDEILFHLRVQQDLLNYTLLVAAALAPVLGLSTVSIDGVLAILLIGPLMCGFMQMAYLKQHLYVILLAQYIKTELGCANQKPGPWGDLRPPFAGWEFYHTKSLLANRRSNWLSGLLDVGQFGFPSLVGFLYLVAFAATYQNAALQTAPSELAKFFMPLMVVDVIFLLLMGVAGILTRAWSVRLRTAGG